MGTILLALSFAFLAIGLIFFYRPAWIVKFNRIARERIFNDSRVLLERRKKGFFLLLMFLIFSYWGFQRMLYNPLAHKYHVISSDRLLYQSMHHLHKREYKESLLLCQRVTNHEPNNAKAFYLLGAAHYLLGDPASAKQCWSKAKAIDPESIDADVFRKLVVRHKNLRSENIPALQ